MYCNYLFFILTIVFSRRTLRSSPCTIYFLTLSIFNLISLDIGLMTSIYANIKVDPSTYSFLYCKVIQVYFRHVLLMITRTYIVLISIDRFCMSSTSVTLRQFSTQRIAIRLTVIAPFVWFLIALYIPFLITLEQQRCIMPGTYGFIYSIYSVIVAGNLPPLVMIIFTWATYYNIKKLRSRVVPTTSVRQQQHQRRDHQLFLMSICQVMVYVISTWLYPSITVYLAFIKQTGSLTSVEQFLNFLGAPFLIHINSAATFYIYICTSSGFRSEFKQMILFYCLRRRP